MGILFRANGECGLSIRAYIDIYGPKRSAYREADGHYDFPGIRESEGDLNRVRHFGGGGHRRDIDLQG